jgi:hypothetical protein
MLSKHMYRENRYELSLGSHVAKALYLMSANREMRMLHGYTHVAGAKSIVPSMFPQSYIKVAGFDRYDHWGGISVDTAQPTRVSVVALVRVYTSSLL